MGWMSFVDIECFKKHTLPHEQSEEKTKHEPDPSRKTHKILKLNP